MSDRKATIANILSSACQTWQTPEWFLDLVREVGPIALDPATSADNPTGAAAYFSQTCGDRLIPWIGPCGLAGDWTRPGLAFVNPPYGPHLSGPVDPDRILTRKCKECDGEGLRPNFYPGHGLEASCRSCRGVGRIEIGRGTGWAERIAQDTGEWIALVPTRTDVAWWHRLHGVASWVVLWRSPVHGSRIKHRDPATGKLGSGATFASSVFYHGPNPLKFAEAFAPHGRLIPGDPTLRRLLTK